MTRLDLSRLVEAGQLVRLSHGVYRDAGAPGDEFEDLRAAWLSTEPARPADERLADGAGGVVIAGASAARLHGVGDLPADLHEFAVAVRRQSQRPEIRYRRPHLDPHDVTITRGLPVTTLERTLADLVEARVDLSLVADVLRDASRKRRLEMGRLAELLAPLAARNGFVKGDGHALLHRLLEIAGLHAVSLARQLASSSDLGRLVAADQLERFARSNAAELLATPASEQALRTISNSAARVVAAEVALHLEKLRASIAASMASIDTAAIQKTLSDIAKDHAGTVDTSALRKAIAELVRQQLPAVDTSAFERAFAEAVQRQLAAVNPAQNLLRTLSREWAAVFKGQGVLDSETLELVQAARSAGLLAAHD